MKAMITGNNGAVAPYVNRELKSKGIDVTVWNRELVGIDNEEEVYRFIEETKPDIFFHIATGPIEWLTYIAKATKKLGVKLVFTSTVSVYSEDKTGPYTPESIPDAENSYGVYKIQCEKLLKELYPEAYILRLGWQIGSETGSNNMFDFLCRGQQEKGCIEASSQWYPSCSFLEETAAAVVDIALNDESNTYLLNSNRKYSFYDIVLYLKELHQQDWKVVETNALVRDDRMFDDRINMKPFDFS
ncbi:sugar nucleotide-binding protein [Paenibacillus sp. CF384]|uniref:sugar nucleotide-binding protein n=1 Tax=Paenibacillus sp. CF384 TaxID=1884382 RepID=UPI000896EE4B|nr:sugar nucleotide-binding protein [Paenibacillus sp. CF384]SDX05844.1 dTDP-4-dehydrorhamnose reductase [Paenibacillus sp. CF384]